MVDDPEEDTQHAMFRLMTEMNGKLDQLLDWRVSVDNDLSQLRARMQGVEQQAVAFGEQAALIHKRLDDMSQAQTVMTRKLDLIRA